ncbi:MAG: 1-acyl-sn-glycerol-3-phosphate acyltransferase [Muribaculum sp.]|nr:1-acyl-sn-glycerol-3-phosphate acyltransferase [Muribaculaceae bacterium]MCM1081185.1 1-acyl-sn-glycerol-3-phosphate acyltransferase [Muribaculum sp.]
MQNKPKAPLKIDIDAVLRERIPGYYKRIPKFIITWIKRTICQDDLNGILERTAGTQGSEFCDATLTDLNITYKNIGVEPDPDNRNVIIASNHPLGALDGIAMIDWASRHYGTEVKFVVNDLLMSVKPLEPVFLPVNKFGKQNRISAEKIGNVFSNPNIPIIVFPAGLCSRKGKNGVADLKWQKMFINKAVQYHRDIIPVFFSGKNSPFFYNFAKFRQKLGIKLNIEMLFLPREIFRSRGKSFNIVVGETIPWQNFTGGANAAAEALAVREKAYSLSR